MVSLFQSVLSLRKLLFVVAGVVLSISMAMAVFGQANPLTTPRLQFDGANDRVDMNALDVSGTNITIEAWFNASNLNNCSKRYHDCRIISKASGDQTDEHFWMVSTISSRNKNDVRLRFRLKTNNATTTLIANDGLILENEWYHAAATYDGSTMRLFLDGVEVGSTTKSGALDTDPSVAAYIGNNPVVSNPWAGEIDDVRIWNVARTANEIISSKDTELSGNEPGLVAYYPLNEAGGQVTADLASSNDAFLGTSLSPDSADPTWINIQTDTQPPTIPENVVAQAVSSNQIDLSWDASTDDRGVMQYRVVRDNTEVATTTSTTYSDVNLTELTTYNYYVVAEDTAGNLSAPSTPVVAQTPQAPDTQPPSNPTNLQATTVAETQVDLSWQASTDNVSVVEYAIFRDTVEHATVAGDTLSYTDMTVVPNASYAYTVVARDGASNQSGASNEVVVTTPNVPDNEAPTVPQNVAAIVNGDTSVDLGWDASTDNVAVSTYIVERDGAEIVQTTSTTYTDTAVNPINSYTYRVYSQDASGNRSGGSAAVVAEVLDITAPTVSINQPQDGAVLKGTLTIALTANDDLGVADVKVFEGSNILSTLTAEPYQFDWDTTTVADGEYILRAEATDTSGNVSQEATITVVVRNNTIVNTLPGSQHLTFDGVNDWVNLGALDANPNALTLEAWVNNEKLYNCYSGDCRIISKATGTQSNDHYWMLSTIKQGSNASLRFRLKLNGTTKTLIANTLVPEKEWVHTAATYDGAHMRLYQNGVEIASLAATGTITANSNIDAWVGANPANGDLPWKGALDDIRIWGVARSQAEIAAAMNLELTGNEAGLQAYYRLNEGIGQVAYNSANYALAPALLGSTAGQDPNDPVWAIPVTDTQPPTAPGNLQASTPTQTEVALSWDASTDDTSVAEYVVMRDGSEVGRSGATQFTDQTLSADTTYNYHVYALDSAGNQSPASPTVTVTTPPLPPPQPLAISNIHVTNILPTRATITWTTNDYATSKVTYGFDISYGTTAEDATAPMTLNHTVVLDNLTPEQTYHFAVTSTNSAGSVTSGDLSFTTIGSGGALSFEHSVVDPSSNSPRNPHNKKMADVNADGQLDLVVASSHEEGIYWYAYPTWEKHHIANGSFSTDMDVGDIDGDGDTDFIMPEGSSGGVIVWFENPLPNGDPTSFGWTKHIIGDNRGHDVEVIDLDNDGLPEVIARGSGKTGDKVVLWKNNGGFTNWQQNEMPAINGEGLYHGDINGDGFVDLISTNQWHQNPASEIATNAWTTHQFTTDFIGTYNAIATGDFNNDGRLDIAQSSSEPPGADGVYWFEAPLDPTQTNWTKHDIDTGLSDTVHGVRVADFNNDGVDDIVLAEMHQSSDPDEVAVYINQGPGLSWYKLLLSNIGSHNVDVGDIDSDGDIDIFGANHNHLGSGENGAAVELWRNLLSDTPVMGSESLDDWSRATVNAQLPWRAVFVEHADINGDSYQDIVAGAWWYENPGTVGGTWTQHTIGGSLNNVAVVYDFDGDGDADLLGTQGQGSQSNNEFVWAENDGTGSFTVHANVAYSGTGDFLQGVAVDTFTAGSSLQVALSWHNGGDGTYLITIPSDPVLTQWTSEKISTTTQEEALSSGDIDLDGDNDLLLGNMWLRNDGGGSWSSHTLFTPSGIQNLPDRNKLVDINGDGRLDAVVGYEAISVPGRLAWYEQPQVSTDQWIEHIIDDAVIGPMSLDTIDMNMDGLVDVVVGEHNLSDPAQARLLVYENLSVDGTSWQSHLVYTGDEHHDGAQVVDLDNDSDYDIISVSWGTRALSAYENTSP